MASFWKNLFGYGSPTPKENGSKVNDEPKPVSPSHYPNTYREIVNESKSELPPVFDPALRHFPHAFRQSEPVFESSEISDNWHATRNQVIDHILQIINASKWKDHLVLRGSLLLKAWLGDAAREPGDIDWVFRPATVGIDDAAAAELFEDLIQMISRNEIVGDARIEASRIVVDDIWTYERAAGRRILFPWKSEALPSGFVQMDVVFNEQLWCEPVETLVPTCGGSNQSVWSVNKEVSLAWKLLWLETDIYPQGKDLYDAALLAEQTHLPLSLLKEILQSSDWKSDEELTVEFPLKWEVDWKNFKLEYPWVTGEAREWQARLSSALTPTFAGRDFCAEPSDS